jgi:hypothetical protein
MMPFDCYADNYSVPPKSCCPQEVRESLPQSHHSLAVSEPDPITLFTPYILSVPSLSNAHAINALAVRRNNLDQTFRQQIRENFYLKRATVDDYRQEFRPYACMHSILFKDPLYFYVAAMSSI